MTQYVKIQSKAKQFLNRKDQGTVDYLTALRKFFDGELASYIELMGGSGAISGPAKSVYLIAINEYNF